MSGVLVDTSVWIDHFRNRNEALVNLLNQDLALTHPMVIGEIACGTPPAPRTQTLGDLGLELAQWVLLIPVGALGLWGAKLDMERRPPTAHKAVI